MVGWVGCQWNAGVGEGGNVGEGGGRVRGAPREPYLWGPGGEDKPGD